MNCLNCGNEISENKTYCSVCEENLKAQKIEQNNNEKEEEVKPSSDSKYAVMTTGGYLAAMTIMAIPVIGWIVALVWALGGTKKVNKRNFARATIVVGITIALVFVLIGALISWAIGFLIDTISGGLNNINLNEIQVGGSSISEMLNTEIDVGSLEGLIDMSGVDGMSEINLEDLGEMGEITELLNYLGGI